MLPEEFPVVLTIFLALGAWRLSKRNVLTRRIPAVETLGATTALCVDKTGTLTLNKMSVADLCVDGEILELESEGTSLPEKFHPVVEYAILASPADPFRPNGKSNAGIGQADASEYGAPASRLGSSPRISALARVPYHVPRVAISRPIHIVFLELIIDPACTVVFEAEQAEKGVMDRPPRQLTESLFGFRSLVVGMIQGGAILAGELIIVYWTLSLYHEQVARTAAFTIMVLCNLGLILLSRAGKRSLFETIRNRNRPQILVTLGALIILTIAIFLPWLQNLFLFSRVPMEVIGISAATTGVILTAANIARRWNVN